MSNKKNNKKHILSITKDDFEIKSMRAGGKGGQHQNKTNSAIRIKHIKSGVEAVSREHKSQHRNKKEAFNRLVNDPEFRKWLDIEIARVNGKIEEAEREVERQMNPNYLKIEIRDENGRWVLWEDE